MSWEEVLKKKKRKSTVNQAGNYTKPEMRKRIFNRIKAGTKGGAAGQWSARKAQMLAQAYKKAGGGIAINWRNLLKAKAKSQRDLEQWTDEEWGSQEQHRAKSKGKKVPSKTKGRYMPKATYQKLLRKHWTIK